ncbi:MAG: hypothetical protein NTW29_22350 [Bacteroidetes bacterium]|nr:hypothetical protein [Bacteroidota bacterium]
MIKIVWALALLVISIGGKAQSDTLKNGEARQSITHIAVLADSNFSFSRVLTDTTLPFRDTNRLSFHSTGIYWIRLHIDNPSGYGGNYTLYTQPFLDNTVYCFNKDENRWIETRTGALVHPKARLFGLAACTIEGGKRNAIYIRVNISRLGTFSNTVKARFGIEKEAITQKNEQQSWAFCLTTILLVLLFLLYNAIVYLNTKDRAYLYYLLIQIGGILYIAGNFRVFNYLISWQNINPWISPSGNIHYYHLNLYIERLGMVLAISSYVQFTRSYLQTRLHLPGLDKLMRYLLYGWILFELIHNTVSFSKLAYLDIYTSLYSNLTMVTQLLLIITAAVLSVSRGVYTAKYFLWTNLTSILLLIILAGYYMFIQNGVRIVWLPCVAIISQAVLFSMALVARLRMIRNDFDYTQKEAEQLKNDIELLQEQHMQLTDEHQQISAAIAKEKSRNESLEDKLAANNRQLASATLYIVQKNELLVQLKNHIQKLGRQIPNKSKDLLNIESNLLHNQFLENDWEKFKLHFEEVHPRFFEELKAKYPNITSYETRLCAYLHMNLSTKEIAGLLSIDPASVRRAKTRLNRKMNSI